MFLLLTGSILYGKVMFVSVGLLSNNNFELQKRKKEIYEYVSVTCRYDLNCSKCPVCVVVEFSPCVQY
jgi:hypothetical protein